MLYWIGSLLTTDPLERTYGKFQQEAGEAHFLIAQSIVEKVQYMTARLHLDHGLDIDQYNSIHDGHECKMCKCKLCVTKSVTLSKRLKKV